MLFFRIDEEEHCCIVFVGTSVRFGQMIGLIVDSVSALLHKKHAALALNVCTGRRQEENTAPVAPVTLLLSSVVLLCLCFTLSFFLMLPCCHMAGVWLPPVPVGMRLPPAPVGEQPSPV